MQSTSLVRITLENFKSYVGRHEIGPFSNFSCIVGPNGSGKSNITDAIGFVLGIPLEYMRTISYHDFVSRGCTRTDVTLILSLAGEAHSITKTVILKGKDEVIHIMLNNSQITQLQLTEFLVRCNIHVELKNFLIFQNEVAAITQKKATELTETLENISGSGECKPEYEEIRTKIQSVNKKLSALAIEKKEIMAEINRFRSQKKEYDRYRDLHEKEKTAKMHKSLFVLLLNECQLIEKKEVLSKSKSDITELEKKYNDQVQKMKDSKVTFAEIHRKHLLSMKLAREKMCEYRDANANYEKMRTTIEHLKNQVGRLDGESSLENKALTTISETKSKIESSIRNKEKELEAISASWRHQEEEESAWNLPDEYLQEYKNIRKEVDCETVLLRQKMDSVRKTNALVEDTLRRDQLLADDTDASLRANRGQLNSCTERIEYLILTKGEISNELHDTKETYDCNRASFQHSVEIQSDKKSEIDRITVQIEAMQNNMEESTRRKNHSEALASLKAVTRGVRGRLVDLCSIPNEKYRVAATVALGKHMESIVVETQNQALECVRYLKENKIGVMEFIPLDSVKGKPIDERCRSFGGTCRPAVDIFKYDAWLEPAIRYALGQTLVCDNIEEAKKVAFNSNGARFAVVTVDGCVILKNGALQGGLQSIREKIRKWDEKSYNALKEKKIRLQMELFETSGAHDALKLGDLEGLKHKIESLKKRLKLSDDEILNMSEKIRSLDSEHLVLEESRSKSGKRIKSSEASMVDMENKLNDIQQKIRVMEIKAFSKLQKKVGKLDIFQWEEKKSHRMSHYAEKKQQIDLQMAVLKNQLLLENEKYDLRNVSNSEKHISALQQRIRDLEKDITGQKALHEKLMIESRNANTQLESVKKNLSNIESEIRSLTESTSDIERKISEARKFGLSSNMECEKYRAERFNVFLSSIIENCLVPYILCDSEASENGRKSHRRSKITSSFSDGATSHESLKTKKLCITRSEIFDISDNPLIRSAIFDQATESQHPGFVCIDFSLVPEKQRQSTVDGNHSSAMASLERSALHIREEINAIEPHAMAIDGTQKIENSLCALNNEIDKVKAEYKSNAEVFHKVKEIRYTKFQHTYELVNEAVGKIYKTLTEGTRGSSDVHGTAYLTLDNQEEPYLYGTKYHATPPLKRFMGMHALSGGERTMAALALLFALQSVRPAPFIVLDEVDAALDLANIQKLAQYFRDRSSFCQFLVVSLNPDLYSKCDSLFGVFKDKAKESSALLSLDLTQYAE